MYWNNRIFKHITNGEVTYSVHECFYDTNGKTQGWTQNPISIGGYENIDELINDLRQILDDAERCRDKILDFNSEPENPLDYKI